MVEKKKNPRAPTQQTRSVQTDRRESKKTNRSRRPLTLSIIQQRKGGRQGRHTHNISPVLSIKGPKEEGEGKDNQPASVYLIDHVGPVGGGQHGDVLELLNPVHLCQELSQDPVPYAAGARGAGGGK